MDINKDAELIAERLWEYTPTTGEKTSVRVTFTKPKRGERGKMWEVTFLIIWSEGSVTTRKVNGTDSLDALILAVKLFKIECAKIREKLGDSVTFDSGPSLFGYDEL